MGGWKTRESDGGGRGVSPVSRRGHCSLFPVLWGREATACFSRVVRASLQDGFGQRGGVHRQASEGDAERV